MARFNRNVDANVIAKREKEGRGRGTKASYQPWEKIQDIVPVGRVSRILGCKTNRQHEICNKLHLSFFYIVDWSPKVIDIQERFPLPLKTTLTIADKLGICHPSNKDKEPVVIVLDFLITVQDKTGARKEARAVLYEKSLNSRSIVEKLEIQRSFCKSRNIDFGIVTNRDIPEPLVRNLEEMHPNLLLERFPLLQEEEFKKALALLDLEISRDKKPLVEITNQCDKRLGFKNGMCLAIAYYLIAKRHWPVDMQVHIHPGNKLPLLT